VTIEHARSTNGRHLDVVPPDATPAEQPPDAPRGRRRGWLMPLLLVIVAIVVVRRLNRGEAV
jgi:hypothetical protein